MTIKTTKPTKYFQLYSALKSGGDSGVTPESLQQTLGFNQSALAVYIHALRNKFGADIESVRNGKSVVAYKLINAAALDKTMTVGRKHTKKRVSKKQKVLTYKNNILRSIKTEQTKTKTEDGSVPVPDADFDFEYNDSDLADIRQSLGL
jgi:biotin operon repressor